ncbi:cell division DNA translocase FtsK/SpoIIIE family protein [Rhizobium phaseoli]|uniref:Cell division protein n=1 Tax=Rhizobium etli (strain CIAT 652) TaxID=491916 RepID=B3PXI1_RHIE6|nr:DNA translocase FtsK [Rhizobium phaseoli]ACE89187.1 cell division protein [Rhizobium etli CIAT 652]ANL63905.1 cell division DNA translocase FtsK/SpoIIIE family protein [Rhizobium phaseoli]ANL70239.1 cell division DNA translocase FtsK/SpoIIIE family protein [Rhizobium phaseoli]ANL76722.1 cell division DNA translocase FtsK/SpoIIIE family protein [Rhizobium phaseoli]
MRFPRTNLTDAADFSSGFETELAEENPGERPAAPIWQSNFSLAPNVRFTRTPETLISRRRPPNEPVHDEPPLEQQAIRIEPVAVDVPFDIYLPEPSELAAAPAPMIETPQPLASGRAETPALRAASELSSISDFAFWEVMAFEEGEPVRTPSIVVPKIETTPESITALFRVMEWRPGAPKPAPAASRPIQPPAARPAATALRPPAAISLEKAVRAPEPIVLAPRGAPPVPQTGPMPQTAPVLQAAPLPQAAPAPRPTPPVAAVLPSPRLMARPEKVDASGYEFPPRALLQEPPERLGEIMSQETLEQNAGLLESVLEDFGIKGEIIHVRPGPVVTLYEFEPAPGVKSSRVIGLADDIARSMSALSARVAVVPGRNVIGIELPNVTRETVYFREMIESQDFDKSGYKLALGLGKTIGGEPVIAELAKMPHLLVAGTTGSGKSVAINTMILSLLYRMTPEQCRLIMVDPKMLELSVYDGIPHLLTPVVTDPKKAVMALKWAVREMEERYRKMSRLGVRNIDGYNGRVCQAREKGETIHIMVQTGFDKGTGAPIEESQELDLAPMPYIVVIVDEMADLMMVAGKEIEGAIQRLAQMARAAGIHLIMATQRPSVDVITGTIKANFPTRISFQVTSKIDSRTILGEQGAEQLLGQGDMLHMQGGGRIARVHGPFVSDAEVEKVVAHLKTQGRPEYLDTVTADEEEEPEEEEAGAVFDKSAMASEDGNELYEQAVKVVMRDKKCSTSYIQRRLGIGYNRAASLVERMEKEGLVGPANHVGKREIVSGRGDGE